VEEGIPPGKPKVAPSHAHKKTQGEEKRPVKGGSGQDAAKAERTSIQRKGSGKKGLHKAAAKRAPGGEESAEKPASKGLGSPEKRKS